MHETLLTDGCIAKTVSPGLHLATTLRTYVTSFEEAGGDFGDIVSSINSTASALTQLQRVIDSDKAVETCENPGKVLKNVGCEHIMVLTVKCCKVYSAIPVLIAGVGHSKYKCKAKLPTNHQEMTIFDVSSLKWPWLKPRIKRCQKQLKWLEISLLFILQLAALA